MTGKEIFGLLSENKIPPRIPFVPTVFEHAAKILGVSPSRMAKDVDLIVEGQLKAYEMYRHDLVSVGVDIYNVEAEGMGCSMIYYEDNTIPSTDGTIISGPEDLKNMDVPDPLKTGRMPVFIEACERINSKIGKEVPVSGTVVGPFTLAAILRGFEDFMMDMIFEEEFAAKQLQFACDVGIAYGKAFAKRGIGVAINESWITPPLLKPDTFKEKVFEFEKKLITAIKAEGIKGVALISGGNTAPIADSLVQTGTSLLMADSVTDQRAYKKLCEQWKINLRASIEPKLVEKGDEAELEAAVKQLIEKCAANGKFIFGCGVVSFDTEPEKVLKLKEIVERNNPYQ